MRWSEKDMQWYSCNTKAWGSNRNSIWSNIYCIYIDLILRLSTTIIYEIMMSFFQPTWTHHIPVFWPVVVTLPGAKPVQAGERMGFGRGSAGRLSWMAEGWKDVKWVEKVFTCFQHQDSIGSSIRSGAIDGPKPHLHPWMLGRCHVVTVMFRPLNNKSSLEVKVKLEHRQLSRPIFQVYTISRLKAPSTTRWNVGSR